MTRKRRNIVLWVVGSLAAVSLVAATPGLIGLAKQWRIVKQDFRDYGQALVDQRYADAYRMAGPQFQEATSFDAFVAQQRRLIEKYGQLKAVNEETMNVKTYRRPPGGVTIITASLDFGSRTVRFTYEFHLEGDRWALYGYKQL